MREGDWVKTVLLLLCFFVPQVLSICDDVPAMGAAELETNTTVDWSPERVWGHCSDFQYYLLLLKELKGMNDALCFIESFNAFQRVRTELQNRPNACIDTLTVRGWMIRQGVCYIALDAPPLDCLTEIKPSLAAVAAPWGVYSEENTTKVGPMEGTATQIPGDVCYTTAEEDLCGLSFRRGSSNVAGDLLYCKTSNAVLHPRDTTEGCCVSQDRCEAGALYKIPSVPTPHFSSLCDCPQGAVKGGYFCAHLVTQTCSTMPQVSSTRQVYTLHCGEGELECYAGHGEDNLVTPSTVWGIYDCDGQDNTPESWIFATVLCVKNKNTTYGDPPVCYPPNEELRCEYGIHESDPGVLKYAPKVLLLTFRIQDPTAYLDKVSSLIWRLLGSQLSGRELKFLYLCPAEACRGKEGCPPTEEKRTLAKCSKDPRVIDRSFIDHFEGTEVALEVGFADVTEWMQINFFAKLMEIDGWDAETRAKYTTVNFTGVSMTFPMASVVVKSTDEGRSALWVWPLMAAIILLLVLLMMIAHSRWKKGAWERTERPLDLKEGFLQHEDFLGQEMMSEQDTTEDVVLRGDLFESNATDTPRLTQQNLFNKTNSLIVLSSEEQLLRQHLQKTNDAVTTWADLAEQPNGRDPNLTLGASQPLSSHDRDCSSSVPTVSSLLREGPCGGSELELSI